MAFEDTWTALRSRLQVGATIRNWTVHSGEVGGSFEIEAIGRSVIVVITPGATTPQLVQRSDFEAVYGLWDDYVLGATPRSAFTPLTRCSKYVISILHWWQQQLGGRLP